MLNRFQPLQHLIFVTKQLLWVLFLESIPCWHRVKDLDYHPLLFLSALYLIYLGQLCGRKNAFVLQFKVVKFLWCFLSASFNVVSHV
jgi:hypothetical protein